ncbi:porin family protein [Spirosoma montaniterrae]|uniref:Outer membrane protein beta-barrel domain-containing protein n=1 Tax=Spirosoma montaniterrae TaxID=1178516 RepID=A0A1P9WSZ1_9BACT|nr:porin family protein [Spirosoma montaniterrae]AQG78504.1 hypothetical protein AWR27_03595 [Spirosoma montaniterrae]
MKTPYFLATLISLTTSFSLAQTRPVTPPSSTTQPTSTNRQQELYDQYHGITKKPAAPATPVQQPTRQPSRPAEPPKPQPVEDMASRQPQAAPRSSDGSASGVRIGVRGGVTYQIFTETVTGIEPGVGFVGGLVLNFGAGTFSFQPEINYTRYAATVKIPDIFTGQVITTKNAADVVEIPLLLKIASGTANSTRFFVNVGPYASYLLNTSVDGKNQSLDGREGRFSFGAALGVGTALKTGPGHLTVEVRGLYPLGNSDGGFSTDSRVIPVQATLGYVFPLGGR